jgi:hypothetical protein
MSHISDRVVALTAAASARDTVRPRPPRQAHAARLRSRFGWADATPEFSMPRREKRWQPRMDWAISGRGWLCFLPCRAWTMGHVYSIYIYILTHSLTHSLTRPLHFSPTVSSSIGHTSIAHVPAGGNERENGRPLPAAHVLDRSLPLLVSERDVRLG